MAKTKRKPSARTADKGLTPKQEAFAAEFVKNGENASAAYRATYNAKRMKAETVHEAACRLTADSKVAARISELKAEQQAVAREQFQIEARDVLALFIRDAFYDARDFLDADGNVKPADQLTDAQARMVKITFDRNGRAQLSLPDRDSARDQLGKIFDLTNRLNVDQKTRVTVSAADAAEAATDPLAALSAFELLRAAEGGDSE